MASAIRWYEMSTRRQMANVGSEVGRAIRWKNKGNARRKVGFCNKAIEFLEITKEDPKNQNRRGELDACIEELRDYFLGENEYNTTDDVLIRYYDAFLGR